MTSLIKKHNKISVFLFLLISVVLFSLLGAKSAKAFDIFGWPSAVLDALDFIDYSILVFIVKLTILAFLSGGFAVLSAFLLQWAIDLPLYLHNPAVLAGFHFIGGLVNLFFVLAIVFIALAYILKIETFQLKKAFVRLIIAILLVNFSLLIVGAFADTSQFFMNTLLDAYGKDFVTIALLPLRSSLGSITYVFLAVVGSYVAASFIPFGAPFMLAAIGVMIWLGDLLGNIFSIMVLILLNVAMGVIFFTFTILFIVRIAALWILGIFAPLGVLCFVFEETRKYGMAWLKGIFGWATLGIVAFLLLGLVISIFSGGFLNRPGEINVSPVSGVPSFQLPPSLYNYLFLVIFLAVAFYASVKYVPKGAEQIIKIGEKGLKSIGGVAGATSLMKRGVKEVARKITPTKYKKKAEMWATTPTPFVPLGKKGVLSKLKFGHYRPYVKRMLGRAISDFTSRADEQVFTDTTKKASKQSAAENLTSFLKAVDRTKKAAYLAAIVQDGRKIRELTNEKIYGENALQYQKVDIGSAVRTLAQMGKKKDLLNVLRALPNQKELVEKYLEEYNIITKNDLKEKGLKNITQYIVKETRDPDEIELFNKGWFKNEDFMEAAHLFWEGPQVGTAARIFKREFTDPFNEHMHPLDWYYEIDPETGRMRNAPLPRFLASTGAMNAGLYPIEGGGDKKELDRRFRAGRRKEKEEAKKRKAQEAEREAWEAAGEFFNRVEEEIIKPSPKGRGGIGFLQNRKKKEKEEIFPEEEEV